MMRIKSLFLFIIVFIITPVYATDIQNLEQKWSDTIITTKIKTKFTKSTDLNPLKISVKTKNGVVSLRGHAKNNTSFVTALRMVADTQGVKAVDTSHFDIKSVNSSFTDAYITAKVEAAILEAKVFDDESIPLVGINASTNNGIVTLTGTVKSEHAITVILRRTHHVRGVKKIKSYVKIAETTSSKP